MKLSSLNLSPGDLGKEGCKIEKIAYILQSAHRHLTSFHVEFKDSRSINFLNRLMFDSPIFEWKWYSDRQIQRGNFCLL